jgi:hypothetical protein
MSSALAASNAAWESSAPVLNFWLFNFQFFEVRLYISLYIIGQIRGEWYYMSSALAASNAAWESSAPVLNFWFFQFSSFRSQIVYFALYNWSNTWRVVLHEFRGGSVKRRLGIVVLHEFRSGSVKRRRGIVGALLVFQLG